jgi:ferrochelatase
VTIEDVVNLTEGRLLNRPAVQAVSAATAFPSKVEEGDLFFAVDPDDIDDALARGAYAIVCEAGCRLRDPEVAWIEVDSLRKAAFRLLRYVVLKKEARFVYLRPHEMTFVRQILTQRGTVTFVSPTWYKAFEQILNGSGHLFATTDRELLEQITPDYETLESEAGGYMVSDTLFRSTFRVGSYVYQDRELAPFHLPHLLRAVAFCEAHALPYAIDRVRYTRHFLPVYVGNDLEPVARGSSDRVLIFTDNLEDIVAAREYIRYQATWVKSIVLTPPKTKVENVDRPHWYTSADEAMAILKQVHYNYAFIYALAKEELSRWQTQKQPSLF